MSAGPDDAPARIGQLVTPENMSQALVQLSVTLAVGVLIVGQMFNAIPAPPDGALTGQQVEQITAQAFELAPVILIVIVAAVVISVVRRI
mgnify:CR=1 FL=1